MQVTEEPPYGLQDGRDEGVRRDVSSAACHRVRDPAVLSGDGHMLCTCTQMYTRMHAHAHACTGACARTPQGWAARPRALGISA